MLSSSVDDVVAGLRRDVEHLASLDRRTTSPGERSSADWIAGRLRDIGAADVTSWRFRSQSSWAPVNLAHVVAAMAAGTVPGIVGRVLAAAVATSYELDVSGRSHWLRRLLPAKTGLSVTGRIPLPGDVKPDKTLVLVAHHDAAHNGIVWHRRTVALNRMLSRRTGETMPTHVPALVAMVGTIVPMKRVRLAAQFILGAVVLAALQSMRSHTTPGANDNATGVAAALEVAKRMHTQHLPNMDVLLVFPGGEEAGNTGMRAWAGRSARHLDPDRTLVVGLDSLGSGGHLVVARREGLTGWMDARDVQLASSVASSSGIALKTVSFPNVCDTAIARHKGLHAISLLSYESGWIRNLHLQTDTVEEVQWNTVCDAVHLTQRLALAWADRQDADG
jgi:hypothetical protein